MLLQERGGFTTVAAFDGFEYREMFLNLSRPQCGLFSNDPALNQLAQPVDVADGLMQQPVT